MYQMQESFFSDTSCLSTEPCKLTEETQSLVRALSQLDFVERCQARLRVGVSRGCGCFLVQSNPSRGRPNSPNRSLSLRAAQA